MRVRVEVVPVVTEGAFLAVPVAKSVQTKIPGCRRCTVVVYAARRVDGSRLKIRPQRPIFNGLKMKMSATAARTQEEHPYASYNDSPWFAVHATLICAGDVAFSKAASGGTHTADGPCAWSTTSSRLFPGLPKFIDYVATSWRRSCGRRGCLTWEGGGCPRRESQPPTLYVRRPGRYCKCSNIHLKYINIGR